MYVSTSTRIQYIYSWTYIDVRASPNYVKNTRPCNHLFVHDIYSLKSPWPENNHHHHPTTTIITITQPTPSSPSPNHHHHHHHPTITITQPPPPSSSPNHHHNHRHYLHHHHHHHLHHYKVNMAPPCTNANLPPQEEIHSQWRRIVMALNIPTHTCAGLVCVAFLAHLNRQRAAD